MGLTQEHVDALRQAKAVYNRAGLDFDVKAVAQLMVPTLQERLDHLEACAEEMNRRTP